MQVFLKKIFRKDIVAIFQNITGLLLAYLDSALNLLKDSATRLGRTIDKYVLRERLTNPIIIYQPGKVGSISVQQSLERILLDRFDLNTPVYHAHHLNQIQAIEEGIKRNRKEVAKSVDKLEQSKLIRKEIDAEPLKKWRVISLVRDPVAL